MFNWKLVACTLGVAISSPPEQVWTQAAHLASGNASISHQLLNGTQYFDRANKTNQIGNSTELTGGPRSSITKSRAAAAPRQVGPDELLEDYVRRLAERNFDAIEPLISESAVFWFNDGSHVGLPAIRNAFEKNFASFPLERYWVSDVRWVAIGPNSATCIYRFHWTAQTPEGEFAGGGRGTTALRLEEGGWKIVHVHLSQEPALP